LQLPSRVTTYPYVWVAAQRFLDIHSSQIEVYASSASKRPRYNLLECLAPSLNIVVEQLHVAPLRHIRCINLSRECCEVGIPSIAEKTECYIDHHCIDPFYHVPKAEANSVVAVIVRFEIRNLKFSAPTP
jgi:hypothetical protein